MVLRFAAFALSAALALLASGCAPKNDVSVEIEYICAPPDGAQKCDYGAKCDRYVNSTMFFVTQVTTGGATPSNYDNEMWVEVQATNQRVPTDGVAAPGSLNSADAVISSAKLSYDAPTMGVSIPDRSIDLTEAILPAGATGLFSVPLIPNALSTSLRTTVAAGYYPMNVTFQLKGRYRDGSPLETGPFRVALELYNANFTVEPCPTPTDTRYYCPGAGQTASTECKGD